jgi:hypothetical protein
MVPYGYGKRKEWLEISARSGGVTLWRTSGLLTKWRARMMVLESEKYRERDGNVVGAIVFGYVITYDVELNRASLGDAFMLADKINDEGRGGVNYARNAYIFGQILNAKNAYLRMAGVNFDFPK